MKAPEDHMEGLFDDVDDMMGPGQEDLDEEKDVDSPGLDMG